MKSICISLILACSFSVCFGQSIVSVTPDTAYPGISYLNVTIIGSGINFTSPSLSLVDFAFCAACTNTCINSVIVNSPASVDISVNIPDNVAAGDYPVILGSSNDTVSSNFHLLPPPALTAIDPPVGLRGQTLDVTIAAANSLLTQATGTTVSSPSLTVNSFSVLSNDSVTANITIPVSAPIGSHTISVPHWSFGNFFNPTFGSFLVPISPLAGIMPWQVAQGQTLDVSILSHGNTHFTQATNMIDFEAGSAMVNSVNVINDDSIVTNITVPSGTPLGTYDVTVSNSIDGQLTLSNAFSITGNVGIGEIKDNNEIHVYVNPINEQINVTANNPILAINLYTNSGREAMNHSAVNRSNYEVSSKGLSSGIYLIKVMTEHGTATKRFFIE